MAVDPTNPGNPNAPAPAFVWGPGGTPLTPQALEGRRQLAMAMLKEGSNYSPIASPWQGVARVTDAIMGGYRANKLDQQEYGARQAAASQNAQLLSNILGGGQSAPAAGANPYGGAAPASTVSPTADAGTTPPVAPTGGSIPDYANAIAAVESDGSGGYAALGPQTKTGDRAYGRYQVMGNNIPQWTKEALGQEMTPQQFLADPKAQDAVFAHQFGGYVQKYGNPQDAASAWFTGQPLSHGGNSADQLGTTGNAYVQKFNQALGAAPQAVAAEASGALPPTAPMPSPAPVQTASLDPSVGLPPAPAAAPPDPQVAANGPVLPQAAPIPTDPGLTPGAPAAMTPAGQRVLATMTSLTPLSGRDGVIQAMGGAPAAPVPPQTIPPSAAPAPAGGAQQVAAAMASQPQAQAPMGGVLGGRTGIDPSQIAGISQALANPWSSPEQAQLLGSVLSARLTPHKIEMVPLGDGSTAEIDSITGQQVGTVKGVRPPVVAGYDQRILDPNTGQQIGGGPANGQLPYRFMTQDEKQAAGLPLDTPVQIGPDGKMVSNGITVNTGTPQGQYSDEMTKGLSGPHLALEGGVEAAQEQQRDIHAMQAAVQRIQQNGGTTGMGESEVSKLQSAINTGANLLGADQQFDVSDKEFLTKFNRQIAGAQAKAAGGARVTNFELKNYLAANPGLEMSPQGNERLLGIQNQILQRNIDVGQALRSSTANSIAQGRKVNPAENEQLIRDYDAAHHIMDPITGQDLTQNVKLGGQSQSSGAAAPQGIPPGAINALKADPSKAAEFDQYYGPGASAKVLGQ